MDIIVRFYTKQGAEVHLASTDANKKVVERIMAIQSKYADSRKAVKLGFQKPLSQQETVGDRIALEADEDE